MQKTLIRLSNIVVRCLLLSAVAFCGCETATVYISHPQVFTRERLVVSRQRELQFLYTQLNKAPSAGFQGAIDQRLVQALQVGFAATISPKPSPTSAPTGPINLTSEIAPAATTQNVATNLTLSSEDQLNDALAYRAAVNAAIRENELDDTHDLTGHTLYTLKFDSTLLPGAQERKPVFVLLTLNAVVPQIESREQQTLYEAWLNYFNQRLLQEKVDLENRIMRNQLTNTDLLMLTSYIFPALKTARTDLMTQAAGLDEKSADPDLGVTRQQFQDQVNAKIAAQQRDILLYLHNPDSQTFATHPAGFASHVCSAFWSAVDEKYNEALSGIIRIRHQAIGRDALSSLQPNSDTSDIKAELLVESVVEQPAAQVRAKSYITRFAQGLGIKEADECPQPQPVSENDLYIASIDPQIYAQNLSDVESANRLFGLSVALSALAGNSATLAGSAGYLSQSQLLLQNLKRNPLSVGFRGGQSFGWRLGSPFDASKDSVDFVHQPFNQSFAVSFVAPVWLNKLHMTAEACWIDENGWRGRPVKVADKHHEVSLPYDFEAITTALLTANSKGKRGPTIGSPPAKWVLQTGSTGDQTLLITGTELWRNPEVFVDSQKADSTELLPNMDGLLAHFTNLQKVKTEQQANLTVVTSFGASTLDQQVKLEPPPEKAAGTLAAALAGRFAVAGDKDHPLTFAIDPKSMPDSFAGFVLKVRPVNSSADWFLVDTAGFSRSSDKKNYYFPLDFSKLGPGGTALYVPPAELAVDLRLKLNLFDDPVNLLSAVDAADRSFLYFAKDQEKLQTTGMTIAFDKTGVPKPTQITLGPAAGIQLAQLFEAYPGLQTSLKAGTATLSLVSTDSKTADLPLTKDDTSLSVSLTGQKQTQLPAATYSAALLKFATSTAAVQGTIPVIISPATPPATGAVSPPTSGTIIVTWGS